MKKLLVIGSGFYGATLAQKASELANVEVHVVEKRNHLGGNAWSEFDTETGIEVHKYGSHLFHTSNENVWHYLNQFSRFNNYIHTVKAVHNGNVYSMPINLHTINQFFSKTFSPEQAKNFLADSIVTKRESYSNLEEKAISLIGKPLYEAFIKNYTQKQWQTNPTLLPADIITRLPVRFNYNDKYFSDTYEGLPIDGYMSLFTRMFSDKNIKIETGYDFMSKPDLKDSYDLVVYTGPIDQYFNYCFGKLTWRTLDFEYETKSTEDFQGTSVMNYSDLDVKYTRIHEFKHLHPERKSLSGKTVISREYSRFASPDDEPYYPVNTENDRELFLKYKQLALKEKNVIFGGRLGSYKYLDMHMAIASALVAFENVVKARLLDR